MNLGTYISKLSASTTVSCSFCLVTPCSPMANHLPEPRGMDTQPAAGATTGNSGFYALTSTSYFGGREVSGMAWTKLEAATLDVLPQSCAGRAILLCLQPPKAQLHLVLQMWHPKACFFYFCPCFTFLRSGLPNSGLTLAAGSFRLLREAEIPPEALAAHSLLPSEL